MTAGCTLEQLDTKLHRIIAGVPAAVASLRGVTGEPSNLRWHFIGVARLHTMLLGLIAGVTFKHQTMFFLSSHSVTSVPFLSKECIQPLPIVKKQTVPS